MTAKRDSKSKPKKDERPKLKKEKLKDLNPGTAADEIAGGGKRETTPCSAGCTPNCGILIG
jgi:hypothetical protein